MSYIIPYYILDSIHDIMVLRGSGPHGFTFRQGLSSTRSIFLDVPQVSSILFDISHTFQPLSNIRGQNPGENKTMRPWMPA